MTRAPERIWTGDWQAQSEEARRGAAHSTRTMDEVAETAEPIPQRAARKPRRPRRTRRPLLMVAAGAAALLIVVGAFAGALTQGDNSTTPLPAASDKPVTPRQGQTRAGAVYASASPAVVSIKAGNSTGTGFLIDGEGRVVTNAQVVDGSDRV